MMIHVEVSNPVQWKPWLYRWSKGWRVGWLWFAIGCDHLRLNELLGGGYYFAKR